MSKINPSKKRSGLVLGNIYGADGMCTGKQWMTTAEANERIRLNKLYLMYKAERDFMAEIRPLPELNAWQKFTVWIKNKFK